eukprot:m.92830 g.92830  ORF g.92830 m.92830 type:complete len:62 (-) comp8663_c0_seq3:1329-1514(-)
MMMRMKQDNKEQTQIAMPHTTCTSAILHIPLTAAHMPSASRTAKYSFLDKGKRQGESDGTT